MLKIMTIKVHSPFSDSKEDCLCALKVTLSDKGKFKGGELISAITMGNCELLSFLNQDKLDEIEDDCIVEYTKCWF